jgi:hypothetical protein
MKKVWVLFILAAVLGTTTLTGCGGKKPYLGSWVLEQDNTSTLVLKKDKTGEISGTMITYDEDTPTSLFINGNAYNWKIEDKKLVLNMTNTSSRIVYIRK